MTSFSGVLIVKPWGGLGNRVRVIASFELLARYTGRAFRVCWAPSDGFSDETLDELFENEFDQVDAVEFTRSGDRSLRLDRFRGTPGDASGEPKTSVEALRDGRAQPIVTYEGCFRLDGALRPPLPDLPTTFDAEYRTAVRSWRPVEPIRNSVDAISRQFDSSTVGVHARRGDALHHKETKTRARCSTDGAFFRRMDVLLAADSSVRFFLATDCEVTEARFVDRYGDRIQTNDAKRFVPSHVDGPKENQRDAVIDLFALARTQMILGSYASSFSEVAGAIGDVAVERVGSYPTLQLVRNKVVFETQRLLGRMHGREHTASRLERPAGQGPS